MPRHLRLTCLILICAAMALGQGLNTTATKDDWEEINFEFDSSVLSDGYPSLLRLAELLQQHQDYRVTLEGNTDPLGSNAYNDRLSRARSETVMKFLVKYGARENQISIVARGEGAPKVPNTSKEGRFMNRRVTVVLRDGQGNVVSAGGVGEAIKALQGAAEKAQQCCDDVLKRLDKLDEILAAVKALSAENQGLRQELDALKASQAGLQKQVEGLPRPPERAELQQMMTTTADEAIDKAKPSRFSLLALNLGPTLNESLGFGKGNITVTAKGRYFAPFGKTETSALQAEGEYLYYRDRQEGQFDVGLLHRFQRFQLGLFNSMKHVNLTNIGGGTLGQGAMTADFLFPRGRFGFFGTKGYLDNRVIARNPLVSPGAPATTNFNVFTEQYLSIVDQIGASTTLGAWDDAYFDVNFGALFRRGGTNRPGGMARLVQPINPQWAFTVEAGLNETMIGPRNTGRIVFGLQFGNWLRPKEYADVRHPVPADIPRLRYEVLSRTVRTGNAPPVADAGPDQTGVAGGTVTLDASGSFDPDSDPITYQWSQIAGPGVSLSPSNTAQQVSFTAAEGQLYSFRLVVRDQPGAQGTDTVTVTTEAPATLQVLLFTANPTSITAGQQTTLNWQVENAETVEISGVGAVNSNGGSTAVSPTETTTYTLTARGRNNQTQTQTTTVTVTRPELRIGSFTASPVSISAGQASNLCWVTTGAESAEISGVGGVAANGCVTVSPAQTTTYTLTARAPGVPAATATASITVAPLGMPIVVAFTATPADISVGRTSTLTWDVTNATEVSISGGVGTVGLRGSRVVSPASDTTYTLTARNASGEVTATTTVRVFPPCTVTSFTVDRNTVGLGEAVTFTWATQGCASVRLAGIPVSVSSGSFTTIPVPGTRQYILDALGRGNEDSRELPVTATMP